MQLKYPDFVSVCNYRQFPVAFPQNSIDSGIFPLELVMGLVIKIVSTQSRSPTGSCHKERLRMLAGVY